MSKCNYCAFFSRACAMPNWEKYATDICNEIQYWGAKLGHPNVPTVFFGGGTPSLIPVETFEKIMGEIRQNFNLMPDAEITLESNPATLSAEKLSALVAGGVNRLSIGVQSLDDEKLKFLGRRHSVRDALELINNAQQLGLRVSADFIYGLPNETVDDVIKLCRRINELGLKHCSMYELTIEPDTPFGKMNLNMPDNETMAGMYLAIGENIALPRYEVSNYAAHGNECRHNQNVWDGEPYVGFGVGAAGRVLIDGQWYEQSGGKINVTPMSNDTRATERLITGMRTVRGCELTATVKNIIDMNWVKNHSDQVVIADNRIRATTNGILVLDDILVNIIR